MLKISTLHVKTEMWAISRTLTSGVTCTCMLFCFILHILANIKQTCQTIVYTVHYILLKQVNRKAAFFVSCSDTLVAYFTYLANTEFSSRFNLTHPASCPALKSERREAKRADAGEYRTKGQHWALSLFPSCCPAGFGLPSFYLCGAFLKHTLANMTLSHTDCNSPVDQLGHYRAKKPLVHIWHKAVTGNSDSQRSTRILIFTRWVFNVKGERKPQRLRETK